MVFSAGASGPPSDFRRRFLLSFRDDGCAPLPAGGEPTHRYVWYSVQYLYTVPVPRRVSRSSKGIPDSSRTRATTERACSSCQCVLVTQSTVLPYPIALLVRWLLDWKGRTSCYVLRILPCGCARIRTVVRGTGNLTRAHHPSVPRKLPVRGLLCHSWRIPTFTLVRTIPACLSRTSVPPKQHPP